MNSLTVVYVSLISCAIFFLLVNAVLQIKVKRIAESTHVIVNSQRTMLLRLIAALTKRIAQQNPTDLEAQEAAEIAERDAEAADHPRRVLPVKVTPTTS